MSPPRRHLLAARDISHRQVRATTLGGVWIFLASLASPSPSSAQDVSGTWSATWAQVVVVSRSGGVGVRKWGSAKLELRQQGNSVTGTWTTQVVQTVHWNVAGTFRDGRLSLTATENDASDPQLVAIRRIRWRGAVLGDSIAGDMTLDFQGATRNHPWRPWHAVRASSGGVDRSRPAGTGSHPAG